jgi:hypothetical protein
VTDRVGLPAVVPAQLDRIAVEEIHQCVRVYNARDCQSMDLRHARQIAYARRCMTTLSGSNLLPPLRATGMISTV